MEKCTFCGKSIEDLLTKVTLNTETFRKREDSSVEHLNNLDWTFIEYLCPECLTKFCESLKYSMDPKKEEEDV